ncbi:hypothetical protein NDU88_001891, partial [Pleurodeles waltl]
FKAFADFAVACCSFGSSCPAVCVVACFSGISLVIAVAVQSSCWRCPRSGRRAGAGDGRQRKQSQDAGGLFCNTEHNRRGRQFCFNAHSNSFISILMTFLDQTYFYLKQ